MHFDANERRRTNRPLAEDEHESRTDAGYSFPGTAVGKGIGTGCRDTATDEERRDSRGSWDNAEAGACGGDRNTGCCRDGSEEAEKR